MPVSVHLTLPFAFKNFPGPPLDPDHARAAPGRQAEEDGLHKVRMILIEQHTVSHIKNEIVFPGPRSSSS